MNERTGLRRKIWVAFILQAAAIAFAAILGVYGASAVLKHVLIQRALEQEAAHFWQRLERDPKAGVPDTYNMTGYLRPVAGPLTVLPTALRPLGPGFHSLPRAQGGSLVLVQDSRGWRLYLLHRMRPDRALAFLETLPPEQRSAFERGWLEAIELHTLH